VPGAVQCRSGTASGSARRGSRAATGSPASGRKHSPDTGLGALVARFSLGWLVVANLAGLLLATLLLSPELNDRLAPLTYGRWAPVHLNAQLYGWCALPLVGLLLRAFLVPGAEATRHTWLALGIWSAALAFGAVTWLAGESSGKLFLDWTGPARYAFPLALSVLWSVLAYHAVLRLAGTTHPRADRGRSASTASIPHSAIRSPQFAHLLRFGLLAGLLAVPTVLYFSAGPQLYPAVNPNSGGATGTSLFGSTLGLVLIFAAAPDLLGLSVVSGRRNSLLLWPALAAATALFVALDHGHASHHATAQIAALGLLLAAPWLIARAWRRRQWADGSARWLIAALAWGVLLVADGWLTFLPGFSERLKFTNGLVAHAHLAMAGLITSLNAAFLLNLGDSPRVRAALGRRWAFWLWQSGCAVQVVVLFALGWNEAADPQLVFDQGTVTKLVYSVRWLAGAAMTTASIVWLIAVFSRAGATREDN